MMKIRNLVLAAAATAVMAMSVVACGNPSPNEESASSYEPLTSTSTDIVASWLNAPLPGAVVDGWIEVVKRPNRAARVWVLFDGRFVTSHVIGAGMQVGTRDGYPVLRDNISFVIPDRWVDTKPHDVELAVEFGTDGQTPGMEPPDGMPIPTNGIPDDPPEGPPDQGSSGGTSGGTTPAGPTPDGTVDRWLNCSTRVPLPGTLAPSKSNAYCCSRSCNQGEGVVVPNNWSSRGAIGDSPTFGQSWSRRGQEVTFCIWGAPALQGATFTMGCDG